MASRSRKAFRHDEFPREEANKLLLVGSGFSLALGTSSWATIIRKLAHEGRLRNRYVARIEDRLREKDGEYRAFDELENALGHERLERNLRDLLRQEERRVPKDLLQSLGAAIARLGVTGILTTNWDCLLETATGFKGFQWFEDPICEQRLSLDRCIKGNQGFVLHLHGSLSNKHHCLVKTSQERESAQSEISGFWFLSSLRQNYFVIMGHGLKSDFHVNTLIELAYSAASAFRFPPSVFAIRTAEDEDLERLLPQFSNYGVQINWDRGRTSLLEVLNQLYARMIQRGIPFYDVKDIHGADDVLRNFREMDVSHLDSELVRDILKVRGNPAFIENLVFQCLELVLDRHAWTGRITDVQKAATILYRLGTDGLWKSPSQPIVDELARILVWAMDTFSVEFAQAVDPLAYLVDFLNADRDVYTRFIVVGLRDEFLGPEYARYFRSYYGSDDKAVASYWLHVSSRRAQDRRHAHDIRRLKLLLTDDHVLSARRRQAATAMLRVIPSLEGQGLDRTLFELRSLARRARRNARA